MRPRISDKTEERIRNWMDNHPEKAASSVGEAIDYLVPKGIEHEKQPEPDEIDRKYIEKIIDEKLKKQT